MNPELNLIKTGNYKNYEYEIRENPIFINMSIGLNAYIKVPNNKKMKEYASERPYEFVKQVDKEIMILGFDTHHGWYQIEFENKYKDKKTLENKIEYIEKELKSRIDEICDINKAQ